VPFSYFNPSTGEELVITAIEAKQPLGRGLMEAGLNELIRIRIGAWSKVPSGGNTKILKTVEPTGWLPMQAGLMAFDQPGKVYCQFGLVGYPKRVVQISYYRHKCAEVTDVVTMKAARVMEKCLVNSI
jgi:hypothetical protein